MHFFLSIILQYTFLFKWWLPKVISCDSEVIVWTLQDRVIVRLRLLTGPAPGARFAGTSTSPRRRAQVACASTRFDVVHLRETSGNAALELVSARSEFDRMLAATSNAQLTQPSP